MSMKGECRGRTKLCSGAGTAAATSCNRLEVVMEEASYDLARKKSVRNGRIFCIRSEQRKDREAGLQGKILS